MGKVTRMRFEDKGEETENRLTKTGANQEREEAAGNFRTVETITGVEDEGEIRTEERKEICPGATLMATHAYTRNQESPIGKEIDLQQWDTLVFKGEHAENEHWRLVEDRYGQVGYAPAALLVVILDTTAEEEESDATKKGQENSTEDNQIGRKDWTGGGTKEELFSGSDRWHQEKHYDLRRRLYHPENRFNTEQGGGRSSVLTGSKNIACDRESREDRGKRKWRDHTSNNNSTRRDEQHGQGRNNGDS